MKLSMYSFCSKPGLSSLNLSSKGCGIFCSLVHPNSIDNKELNNSD